MSTGQLPLSSPPVLDIARLRTSLSLVWCAKLKKTNKKNLSNTNDQKQRQVSLFKSQIKTWNKHKEHNSLGTDEMSIRLSKKIKKTHIGWQESLVFHLTNRFCYCSLWQKRKPSRDQETIIRQWASQFLCFHVQSIVSARRNEETSTVASVLPGFAFTVSTQGGGRREEGKRNWWGG